MGKFFGSHKKCEEPVEPEPAAVQEEEEPKFNDKFANGNNKKKTIGGKGKFNLKESFKTQAPIGDIDLSGKNISDNQALEICQLMRQFAKTDVENLDLSHNRISDNGFIEIAKCLNETKITRLVISNNKISDKCTIQVSGALMRNKNLKVLNM